MEKRPYTPPKLRRLTIDEVRAIEKRTGANILGKHHPASSSTDETLPKKEGGPWEPTSPIR